MDRTFVALGSGAAFLGVALGAFGAHALRDRLTPEMMAIYQTGVQYQMIHALALVLVGILAGTAAKARLAGWLFLAGIIIFSGSLYALALSGQRMFGAITPIGGVCFLAGWLRLTWVAARPASAS